MRDGHTKMLPAGDIAACRARFRGIHVDMDTAHRIAHVLRGLCAGLSPEGTAAALGIELRPAVGARYRYCPGPRAWVEYDALAAPAEQQRMVQRAVVLHMLGRMPPLTHTESAIAITDSVWALLAAPPVATAVQRATQLSVRH